MTGRFRVFQDNQKGDLSDSYRSQNVYDLWAEFVRVSFVSLESLVSIELLFFHISYQWYVLLRSTSSTEVYCKCSSICIRLIAIRYSTLTLKRQRNAQESIIFLRSFGTVILFFV